jgi:hypothetical protein
MLNRAPQSVVRNWIMDSRRWDGYKPREGDVIIATPPKVGTTWMQQIVSLLGIPVDGTVPVVGGIALARREVPDPDRGCVADDRSTDASAIFEDASAARRAADLRRGQVHPRCARRPRCVHVIREPLQ